MSGPGDNGAAPPEVRRALQEWASARGVTLDVLKGIGCRCARHGQHGFVLVWPYQFADGSSATRMLALELAGGPDWRNDGQIKGAVMALGDPGRVGMVLVVEGESDELAAFMRRPSAEVAVLVLPGSSMVPDDLSNHVGNGSTVVVATDADEAGDKCAAKVAAALVAAGVEPGRVRRLRPVVEGIEGPDLRDLLEFLDFGVDDADAEFARLLDTAPPVLSAQTPQDLAGEFVELVEPQTEPTEAPPPFPIWVFPEAAAQLVREGAAALPCPPDYIAVPMLAAAAAAVGGERSVMVKQGWFERARLYLPVVGAPGTLKSPALALALAPVHARQAELHEEHHQLTAEWEATCAALDKKSGHPPPPMREVIFTTDVTVEALAALLAREGGERGVLVPPDELAGWARGIGQYKSGRGADRQKWLEAWAGLPWDVERVGRSLYVPHPFVVLTGGLHPDTLAVLVDESGADDGMADRMLVAYPDEVPMRETGRGVSEVAERSWALLWAAVRKGASEGGFVKLSDGAWERFAAWSGSLFPRLELADDGERGALAKLRGHVARLALVLHELWYASEESDETFDRVSEDVMARAITLGEYFAGHFQRVHVEGVAASRRLAALRGRGGLANGTPVTGPQRAELAQRILHELDGVARMTLAALARAVGRAPKDGTVRRALRELQDAGEVARGDDGLYGKWHPGTLKVAPSESCSTSGFSKVPPKGATGATSHKGRTS